MGEMTNTEPSREEYHGSLTIPSETEPHKVVLLLDWERQEVTVRFDAPVAGATEWSGSSVRIFQRPKYTEVQFRTIDLPKETVELAWKFNAGHQDDTLAGVIVPRPNALRVSGDKGFTLVKQG